MNKGIAALIPIVIGIVVIIVVLKVLGAILGLAFKLILIAAVAGAVFLAYKAIQGRIGGPGAP